jgi:hypothetical protein
VGRVSFISNMIKDDLKSGKHTTVLTRFPPVLLLPLNR